MTEERKIPCLVMSRVVGYISPVNFWHKGKQQEWKERKTYNIRKAIEHVGANEICCNCGESSDAGR